ncbi:UNVERIFIED_CONTAM: hypothetical protein NCL1_36593 [Trichonephila clavipes]
MLKFRLDFLDGYYYNYDLERELFCVCEDSYEMNHAHNQQLLLSRKLKDTSQFEIPKFPPL